MLYFFHELAPTLKKLFFHHNQLKYSFRFKFKFRNKNIKNILKYIKLSKNLNIILNNL